MVKRKDKRERKKSQQLRLQKRKKKIYGILDELSNERTLDTLENLLRLLDFADSLKAILERVQIEHPKIDIDVLSEYFFSRYFQERTNIDDLTQTISYLYHDNNEIVTKVKEQIFPETLSNAQYSIIEDWFYNTISARATHFSNTMLSLCLIKKIHGIDGPTDLETRVFKGTHNLLENANKRILPSVSSYLEEELQSYLVQHLSEENTPNITPEDPLAELSQEYIQIHRSEQNLFDQQGAENGFAIDVSEPTNVTIRINHNKARALCETLAERQVRATLHLDESNRYRYPYHIVEIHDETMPAHIYVCDYSGFNTFIQRNPGPLDPLTPRTRAQLCEDDLVWTAKYLNESRWLQNIFSNLRTPVEDLTPELKTNMFWANQRENALLIVLTHFLKHGMIPKSNSRERISTPIETTYRRVYAALQRGSMEGLGHRETFRTVGARLKARYPVLEQLHPCAEFTFAGLYSATQDLIRKDGAALEGNLREDIVVHDRPIPAIDLALRFHVASDWDSFREQHSLQSTMYPESFDAFVRSCEF